jgi:glutamyl-Q tRNA(Asp) synthetase
MPTATPGYRGRFAPTPSGPLHFGSLVAALGSLLTARAQGGEWLVRMEDLDPPREAPGAADDILRTLEAFGLTWDGEVVYQSRRLEAYREAVERLRHEGHAYPCGCSRRDLVRLPDGRRIYPGTCRSGLGGKAPRALRVRCEGATVAFVDGLQGPVEQDLEREFGDFPVVRADGYYAYHLGVVVDDAAQGITEVVRGADLLTATPSQIHLQRLLGLPTPAYHHLPVAVDGAGLKLSKQTLAAPVDRREPVLTLVHTLAFLGQAPPADLADADLDGVWAWALSHFDPSRVPAVRQRPLHSVFETTESESDER